MSKAIARPVMPHVPSAGDQPRKTVSAAPQQRFLMMAAVFSTVPRGSTNLITSATRATVPAEDAAEVGLPTAPPAEQTSLFKSVSYTRGGAGRAALWATIPPRGAPACPAQTTVSFATVHVSALDAQVATSSCPLTTPARSWSVDKVKFKIQTMKNACLVRKDVLDAL